MANAVFTPGSAAERWARLILDACDAHADLKTLQSWAHFVGVSRTSLCDCCRMVHVEPRAARDLARVLRACQVAAREQSRLESVLDVRDSRTLAKLLSRAGLRDACAEPLPPAALLDAQRFVSADNDGLRALKHLVACRQGTSSSSGGHRDGAAALDASQRLAAVPVAALRIEPAAKWLRKH